MISSEAHLRQEEGRGRAASNLEHQPQDRPYAHINAADKALTPVEKCLVPTVLQSQDVSLGLTEPNPDCGLLETQEKGLLPAKVPTKGCPVLLRGSSTGAILLGGRWGSRICHSV